MPQKRGRNKISLNSVGKDCKIGQFIDLWYQTWEFGEVKLCRKLNFTINFWILISLSMLIDTNTEKSIKKFLVNSAVVGTNLVLEPGKKCYNAEIWLKHPKIYVQIPRKKVPWTLLRKPKYPPFSSRWRKFIGWKDIFFKRRQVFGLVLKIISCWSIFISNHELKINSREVTDEKIQNYLYKNSYFCYDLSRFNYENQINLNLIFPLAATGRISYAKSARIYIQQMRELQETYPWLFKKNYRRLSRSTSKVITQY